MIAPIQIGVHIILKQSEDIKGDNMRKRLVILGMIFTMAAMTGCGSESADTADNKQAVEKEAETTDTASDNGADEEKSDENYKSAEDITMDDLMNHEETSADDFEFNDNPEHEDIIITGYIGDDPIVVIPNEINGKPVTAFERIFMNNKIVVAVRIGDNVTEVESDAFVNCEKLKYVVFGKSVKSLGGGNFAGTDVEEVVLNDGLVSIGTEGGTGAVLASSKAIIHVPESVTEMHISGCHLVVKAGSYAEEYVEEKDDTTLTYEVE